MRNIALAFGVSCWTSTVEGSWLWPEKKTNSINAIQPKRHRYPHSLAASLERPHGLTVTQIDALFPDTAIFDEPSPAICQANIMQATHSWCQNAELSQAAQQHIAVALTFCALGSVHGYPEKCKPTSSSTFRVEECINSLTITPHAWTTFSGFLQTVVPQCEALKNYSERTALARTVQDMAERTAAGFDILTSRDNVLSALLDNAETVMTNALSLFTSMREETNAGLAKSADTMVSTVLEATVNMVERIRMSTEEGTAAFVDIVPKLDSELSAVASNLAETLQASSKIRESIMDTRAEERDRLSLERIKEREVLADARADERDQLALERTRMTGELMELRMQQMLQQFYIVHQNFTEDLSGKISRSIAEANAGPSGNFWRKGWDYVRMFLAFTALFGGGPVTQAILNSVLVLIGCVLTWTINWIVKLAIHTFSPSPSPLPPNSHLATTPQPQPIDPETVEAIVRQTLTCLLQDARSERKLSSYRRSSTAARNLMEDTMTMVKVKEEEVEIIDLTAD